MKQWLLTCLLLASPLIGSELVDVSEVRLQPGKAEIQLVQEQGLLFAEVRVLAVDVLGTEKLPSSSAELKYAKKQKKALSKVKHVFRFDKQTKLKRDDVLDSFYTFELEDDMSASDDPASFIVEYELKPVSKQDTISLEVVLFDTLPSLETVFLTVINLSDEKQIELSPSNNRIEL